jgi:hypothetical protein
MHLIHIFTSQMRNGLTVSLEVDFHRMEEALSCVWKTQRVSKEI